MKKATFSVQFFINGKKPQGRSFALYKQIIDDALKEKKG